MVDANRVRRMLDRLSLYLASLDRLAAMDAQALKADPDLMASVKYHFIVSIECCIDLANHTISSERLRAPEDYADSFRVLSAEGILEREPGRKMQAAARFRNRLVHLYWDVDDDLVVEYLSDERATLRSFARAIASYTIGSSAE